MSAGDNSATLQVKKWVHFPKQVTGTARKQNPAKARTACTAYKKLSETTQKCDKHEVSLFEKFHTPQNY